MLPLLLPLDVLVLAVVTDTVEDVADGEDGSDCFFLLFFFLGFFGVVVDVDGSPVVVFVDVVVTLVI